MYSEALAFGMDPATFWASSPRAVHLLIRQARRRGGGQPRAGGRTGPAPQTVRRVRLNRLPHP